jgi:hypothetical protein
MWLLPSHNRPEQCRAVVRRLKETGCSTPGIVIVNGDEALAAYEQWDAELPRHWSMVCMRDNIGLCGALRWAFGEWPKMTFYGLICDDEFVETPGWDVRLIEAAGEWNLAHGNNGDTSSNWPHGFMTWGGELVRAVGNLAPAGLWHLYFDMYWALIAGERRKFCPDVRISEAHHLRGTALRDDTNRAALLRQKEDGQWFTNWRQREARATIDRIRSASASSTSRAPGSIHPTTPALG